MGVLQADEREAKLYIKIDQFIFHVRLVCANQTVRIREIVEVQTFATKAARNGNIIELTMHMTTQF